MSKNTSDEQRKKSEELPNVSKEFLRSNEKLSKNISNDKKRKGGPYSKTERNARRNEVYRLHFEYGYSAKKIADLMKINRHTIDSDIQYLYSTLQKDENRPSLDDLLNKQRARLEFQRNRLMQILEKTNSIQETLQIEKLILKIDSKLTNTYLKINDNKLKSWNNSIEYINKWMKDNRKDNRYLLYGDLITTSKNKKKEFMKFYMVSNNNPFSY